jgi:hypothetical protein
MKHRTKLGYMLQLNKLAFITNVNIHLNQIRNYSNQIRIFTAIKYVHIKYVQIGIPRLSSYILKSSLETC